MTSLSSWRRLLIRGGGHWESASNLDDMRLLLALRPSVEAFSVTFSFPVCGGADATSADAGADAGSDAGADAHAAAGAGAGASADADVSLPPPSTDGRLVCCAVCIDS